jgi:hypothetical protein
MSSLYQWVDFPIGFVRRLSYDMVAAPFRMRPLHYRVVDPLHLGPSPGKTLVTSSTAVAAHCSSGLVPGLVAYLKRGGIRYV